MSEFEDRLTEHIADAVMERFGDDVLYKANGAGAGVTIQANIQTDTKENDFGATAANQFRMMLIQVRVADVPTPTEWHQNNTPPPDVFIFTTDKGSETWTLKENRTPQPIGGLWEFVLQSIGQD